MTLSVFGKVVGSESERLVAALRSVCEFEGVELTLDQLGPDDREQLEACKQLEGEGVFFEVSRPGDPGNASKFWSDAMVCVQQHLPSWECDPAEISSRMFSDFFATTLGRVCSGVLGIGSVAGIALVEGGIEREFVAPYDTCLRRIICDVAKPWDLSPNRVYVCRTGERAT